MFVAVRCAKGTLMGAIIILGSKGVETFSPPLEVGDVDSDGARRVRCKALAPPLEVRGRRCWRTGCAVEDSQLWGCVAEDSCGVDTVHVLLYIIYGPYRAHLSTV